MPLGPLVLVAGHLGLSGAGDDVVATSGRGGRHSRLLVMERLLAPPPSLKRPIAVIGKLSRRQDRSCQRFAFFALVRAGVRIRMRRKSQVLPACRD